ncbi:WS/DGAT/MGAT family O-acyltransferase [Actinokineospora sp.]|uniref:WS/DGAT/MGAT family O-acyltransferase n=1 Tax=Actinokineospora sp. TaxID=1872133 RepID=UPI00403846FE
MQQLSGLDAAFLTLETPTSSGHVGGVCLLDPSDAPTKLDLGALIAVMAQRVPLVPVLRRALRTVPLGLDQPYWIDDENFDLEFHVREVAVPAPGSDAQLAEQISRLHSRPLDRSRPLWEMYLISGLSEGRLAVYTKVHHAAIDGASGAELLTVLLDIDPNGRELAPAEPFRPQRPPTAGALIARAAWSMASRPVDTVRIGRGLLQMLPQARTVLAPMIGGLLGLGTKGDGAVIPTAALRPPPTPFNSAVTPHRKWAYRSVDLADVKKVKNAFGVSVNDVVMAMCAGALRRWLTDHDALPATPLVAMVPVSVRDEASKGKLGNKVSAMLASLPTQLADPVQRLKTAHNATKVAKSQQAAIPPGLVENITDFAPPALAARAARVVFATGVLHRLPPFNVVISNVPGPNVQAYLGGAKVLAYYPVSVVLDGQGLNMTVHGYRNGLHFGLIACRELVPDIDAMAGYLLVELDLLLKAAEQVQTAP